MLRGTGTSLIQTPIQARSSAATDTTTTVRLARSLYNKRVYMRVICTYGTSNEFTGEDFFSHIKITIKGWDPKQNMVDEERRWSKSFANFVATDDISEDSVSHVFMATLLTTTLNTSTVAENYGSFQSSHTVWYDLGVIHTLPQSFTVRVDAYTTQGVKPSSQPSFEMLLQVEDAVEEDL